MDLARREQPVAIAAELQRCRAEGFRGVNVTHPYKRDAFRCVTTLPGFLQGLTSVNTVLFDEGVDHAANTDFSGFCRGYLSQFGQDAAAGRVLMLGTGGVGLAIAYGLMRVGATELVLFDKNLAAAATLLEQLADAPLNVRLAEVDLVAEMQAADGLINATPVGMFQYPGNPFPAAGFAHQQWAFDAVYTPENTEFLQTCRQRGIATLSGFKLFLYQGLDAFEHFTGLAVDDQQVEIAFLERYPLE
ncbi:MAG: hypothetical protein R3E89_17665 [Thiolinea sp.]